MENTCLFQDHKRNNAVLQRLKSCIVGIPLPSRRHTFIYVPACVRSFVTYYPIINLSINNVI